MIILFYQNNYYIDTGFNFSFYGVYLLSDFFTNLVYFLRANNNDNEKINQSQVVNNYF